MKLLKKGARTFDYIKLFWNKKSSQRFISSSLIAIFVVGLICIQFKRWGLLDSLPDPLYSLIPHNYFYSVLLAFTMLLFTEVVDLTFTLPTSVSKAIGKQLEILALILLRDAIKILANVNEPISTGLNYDVLAKFIASSVGSLLIFVCLSLYKKMPHKKYIIGKQAVAQYILIKKNISLCLIISILCLLLQNIFLIVHTISQHPPSMVASLIHEKVVFFNSIYTMLIFADIFLVLVSQRFLPRFQALFRNSSFVIATILMRISFAVPPYLSIITGVVAALYALATTWLVYRFSQNPFEQEM